MKLYYAVPFLFLLAATNALYIDLSVEKSFDADVLYFSYNDTAGTKSFSTELLNNGSQPFYAQVRVDVFGNGTAFTGWSDRKAVAPGNNGFFRIYWLPEESGKYAARLRVYYGGEIKEDFIDISAKKHEAEDVFEIDNVRVFDSHIELTISSNKTAGDAVVIPAGFQNGWMFSQRGGKNRILITYSAPGLVKDELTVYVASKDADYASKKTLLLEKERGIGAKIRNALFAFLQP